MLFLWCYELQKPETIQGKVPNVMCDLYVEAGYFMNIWKNYRGEIPGIPEGISSLYYLFHLIGIVQIMVYFQCEYATNSLPYL